MIIGKTGTNQYRGKSIGKLILYDIEEMLYEKGITILRLDCGTKIDGLCKYYEKYGFTPKTRYAYMVKH